MTASSSVRVAFLLAMIVPGCGPCGIPRGCNVIEAGSIPRREPNFRAHKKELRRPRRYRAPTEFLRPRGAYRASAARRCKRRNRKSQRFDGWEAADAPFQ